MQSYKNNAMPYNTYRQMRTPSCMVSRDNMEHHSLAMAYVPWQTWRDIYDTEKAFHRGTIFKELDMPFLGKGGMRR